MNKGRSYTNELWKSFQKGSHSFVEDGFVHDKTLHFKAHFQKQHQGVAINEAIVQKAEGLSGSGQANFWFTTSKDRSIFIRAGSATNLHVHYDNGVGLLKSINQNIYGGIEFNRSLTQRIGKAGIELFKDNWSFNTRLLYNFTRKTFSLDEKILVKWRDFKLNAFTNINFTNQLAFNKTGVLLTWEAVGKDTIWFSKLYQKQGEKIGRSILQGLIIGCNSNINSSQTIGFEAKINLSNPWRGVQSLWLASQWKWAQTTVKAKVNKQLSHAVTITNKLGSLGEYSFGVQVSEVGTKNRFRFGTQIQLNL